MSGILGIVGASCSGKSTVARLVAQATGAQLFHLDAYVIPGVDHPIVCGEPSYERPHQYDGARLAQDVAEFAGTHPDTPVVVEGFLLFCYPACLALCTTKIFLDAPHSALVARRQARAASGKNPMGFHAGGAHDTAAERGWLANGLEEWARFGAIQATLPGVIRVDPLRASYEVAAEVRALWRP